MYLTICVELAVDHFGIGLMRIDPLYMKMYGGKDFYISFAANLIFDLLSHNYVRSLYVY